MKLVVWNSQGSKWDDFWNNFVSPEVVPPQNEDVMGLLVESGWAPWVTPGPVYKNAIYDLTTDISYFNAAVVATSPFSQAVLGVRRRQALWIPWMNKPKPKKVNTRVSMGGIICPVKAQVGFIDRKEFKGFRRPVVQIPMERLGITIFLVHLISGVPVKAQEEIDGLTSFMSTLVPSGTAAIVVGDMNIDLLTKVVNAPDHWRILNVGVATQQSGGELDYALLYDPNNQYGGATATVLAQYKTPTNGSDHSVLMYSLPDV